MNYKKECKKYHLLGAHNIFCCDKKFALLTKTKQLVCARHHKRYFLHSFCVRKLKIKNSCPGMSLIEVIVWIGILTLLMAAMTVAIINVYRNNSYTFERALAIISVRKGLEQTTRLIREVSYSDSGAYPVVALAANSFTFYADYDNDGQAEQVRFFLNGEDLQRGTIEPSGSPAAYTGAETVKTIVDNVRNIALGRDLFTYYDVSGVQVTNMSDVLAPTFVKIDLIANTGKNPTVNDYELHGSAYMRNLKN